MTFWCCRCPSSVTAFRSADAAIATVPAKSWSNRPALNHLFDQFVGNINAGPHPLVNPKEMFLS